MIFKYFRDADNFSYKTEENEKCSVCGTVGRWSDAGGFYGINEILCICDKCLIDGKLQELDIETNEAFDGTEEEKIEIIYRTPALPTWQNREWPYINGEYCVFEKIASRPDFCNKEEFINSFSDSDRESSDLDRLWKTLPEKKITNVSDGNYDVSVYLFTLNGEKHCTWDTN